MLRTLLWLFLSFLLDICHADCSTGCISCSNSTCIACNFNQGYFLSNSTCEKAVSVLNCETLDMWGGCSVCRSHYVLSADGKSCTAVPSSNIVENCMKYDLNNKCVRCNTDYYFNGYTCLAVPIKISNCMIYASSGLTCTQCASGYRVTPEGGSCVVYPNFPLNCLLEKEVDCAKCSSGYYSNPNDYLNNFLTPTAKFSQFYSSLDLGNTTTQEIFKPFALPQCIKGKTVNCLVFKNDTTCETCPMGTYLNPAGTECVAPPFPAISNCLEYKSLTECQVCKNGYLLISSTNCTAGVNITNCKFYDGSKSVITCIGCEAAFFLSGGACSPRVASVSIASCNATNPKADECLACTDTSTLTNDNLKCLPSILNCKVHEPSSVSTTVLICKECKNLYYLDAAKNCVLGNVTNCLTYQAASNVCAVCQPGFYLSGTDCLPHPLISFCSAYSSTKKGVCNTCETGNILFTLTNDCLPVTTIFKCLTYSSTTTCSKCEDEYYLSNNICYKIPSNENCLQKDSGCTKCAAGYLLVSGTCQPAMSFLTTFCNTTSNDGTQSTFTCLNCKEGTFPLDYKNLYACIAPNQITNTPIANCVRHLVNGGSLDCTQCAPEYVINANKKSCDKQCAGSLYLLSYTTTVTGSNVEVSNPIRNQCGSLLNDCMYYMPHSIMPSVNVCVKCKSGTLPTKSLKGGSNGIYSEGKDPLNFSVQLNTETFISGCLAYSDSTTLYPPTSIPLSNCDSWYQVTTNLLCSSCAFGYTGTVSTVSISSVVYSYVTCSSVISLCDASTRYGGLGLNVNNIISFGFDPAPLSSCHLCLGTSIPFIFFDKSSTVSPTQPFGISVETAAPKSVSVKDGQIVQCLEPDLKTLLMAAEDWNVQFIPNCGLAAVDVSVKKTYKTSSQSIFCVACKPGFRRILDPTGSNRRIMKCVPIENCKSSNLFNYCSQCADGFSNPFLTSTQTPSFEHCFPKYSDPNCLMYPDGNLKALGDFTNHPASYCYACKKGFSFTPDGICEELSSPQCALKNFSTVLTMTITRNNMGASVGDLTNPEYPLYFVYGLLDIAGGCRACEPSFIAMKQTTSIFGCIMNPSSAQAGDTYLSKFIFNCRNYWIVEGNFICKACYPGFVIGNDGKTCTSSTYHPNCLLTKNGACTQCKEMYILDNGVCVEGKILYCLTYNSQGLCTLCIEKYRLVNNMCEKGNLVGCLTYSANGKCSSCLPNYVMVTTSDTTNHCIFDVNNRKCASYDSSINSNTLKCTACQPQYSLTTDASMFSPSLCLTLNKLDTCLAYDIGATIAQSTFKCTSCPTTSFYLADGMCYPRPRAIMNCTTLAANLPVCSVCNSGFFLSQDRSYCIKNPAGLMGCEIYLSETSCSKCMPRYYLNNGQCTYVNTPILNCKYYASETSCDTCMDNYMKVNTDCLKANAFGCKTYSNNNTCATCPEGYGLFMDNVTNYTHCVVRNILNCKNSTLVFPFRCTECVSPYYPLNGQCQLITISIEGCVSYSEASKCSQCAQNLVLNPTGTMCFKPESMGLGANPSCLAQAIPSSPICAVCKKGYFFYLKTRQCEPCPASLGCLVCDYITPEKCRLCAANFEMKVEGSCVQILESKNNTFNFTSIKLMTISAILLLALLLI